MKASMLKRLYPRVMNGLPVLGTPAELVMRHTDELGAVDVDAMVRHYTVMSGVTGFVTGLPGFLLLPVALPADIVGNAAIQLHMTAAIALAGGFDPRESEIQEACMACLLEHIADPGRNEEGEELAKRSGVKVGERVVRFAASRALKHTAQRAGRRIGLGRLPVLGGLLGASTDATLTREVSRCARIRFLGEGAGGGGSLQIRAEPRSRGS